MRVIISGIVVAGLLLSGCATSNASTWRPMVDTQGTDNSRYEQDLVECRAYAEANPEADPETAARDGAIKTGAMMAGVTILTGGLALIPTLAGGIAGAVGLGGWGGTEAADAKYRNIVSNCMVGRGYRVIG